MKDEYKLKNFFFDDRVLFRIPLYQRKYSWQWEHCRRLFDDLEKVHKDKDIHTHFFGSIVYKRASAINDDLLIIDGQQRLTTVSILILAAINAVKNKQMKYENMDFVNDTCNKYLYSKYKPHVERKIKLCPIKEDMLAYDKLFDNDVEQFVPAEQSCITRNYLSLYDRITSSKNEMSFEDLIEAIEKLIVIEIRLDNDDNPQLIFESLNSCGKDLEEADKVRNYLLMPESNESQERLYNDYWHKIELNTGGEPTMFIRDYLTIKNNVISSIENLYFDFKEYHESQKMSREELLRDMLKFSHYYKQVDQACTGIAKIDKKLRQLSNIGSNVCMPFYLNFFDYSQKNDLSTNVIYEVLDVVENYWARRIICALPANALAKIFALLHGDVLRIYREHAKRGIEITVSYAEVLKFILLKKQGTGAFPTNSDVNEMFPKRQIYKMPTSYRVFLFERMENLNSKEGHDSIVKKMNDGTFTIEHIMPQNLSLQWKHDLGENFQEIHQIYLHTFANLTLTGYNQQYGNRPYIEKLEGYVGKKKNEDTGAMDIVKIDGFKNSHFRLSEYMKTHNEWTEKEIRERGEMLLKDFLDLWPMITTAYVQLEKDKDLVSLDDEDVEFTGRTLLSYQYNGEKHDVSSWKEMMINVCKTLYKEKPNEMLYRTKQDNNYLFNKKIHGTTEIGKNCYVWTDSSTKSKIIVLRKIFEWLDISPSELELALVPLDATEAGETNE